MEHERSLSPSALSNLYLLSSLLIDVSEIRTLSIKGQGHWYSIIFALSFCFKAAILVLESKEKPKYFLDPKDKLRSPEELSGIISRSLFYWLNDFIVAGGKKFLVPEDLYPLDNQLSSSYLSPRFWTIWGNGKCALIYGAFY